LVLATKFLSNLYPGDPNGGGSSRKAIFGQCEQSLRRLQTSYIDLYWMHAWDSSTPIEETMRALDDLVSSGKVRYIGFSDTPAWKCTEAQMLAKFRGWAPLIALQIEYSPLKSGVLSGKYAREKHGKHEAGRGAWATSALTDATYNLLDEIAGIAKTLGTTASRVAIAWVQGRPAVTSTIIGARTLDQLEDNLAAIDVKLAPEHLEKLDALSKPVLNFPADLIANGAPFVHGGMTVNGRSAPVWPMAPKGDDDRY
jgi:aryl-alcohol dehydrogenase-like predicted oxidoreductase